MTLLVIEDEVDRIGVEWSGPIALTGVGAWLRTEYLTVAEAYRFVQSKVSVSHQHLATI